MPTLFASYLRVYEPLSAFDRQSQSYWRRYVHDGRAVTPVEGPGRQRTAVIEALGASWTRLPDLPDDAYVLQADETTLICPWNLRVRVAEAALEARDGVPPVLADAFVPPVLAGLAQAVVSDWNSGARVLEYGAPRQHEQISTWSVPLRWFVLVDHRGARARARAGPAGAALPDRDLQGPPAGAPGAVGAAPLGRRRADHRGGRGERPGGWRSSTRARWSSWTTAAWPRCSRTTTLAADDSPALVARGLTALAKGDAEAATAAYEQLVERWRAIQLLERCN